MVGHSSFYILGTVSLLAAAVSAVPMLSDRTQIVFDLPGTVECSDVTPEDFAVTYPSLKVIEAKLRISAQFRVGSDADIVDFLYVITSPDNRLQFLDFLPNTLLESAVTDDQIEITETTDSEKKSEIGSHVGYQALSGGLSTSKIAKTTQTRHYKEIAPREVVVASGTTDNAHGVFFKLKPSRTVSLEGAKEFSVLVKVPKTWRAGFFTISCAARAKSKVPFSRTTSVPAGLTQSQVGLFLMGDSEAHELANDLATVQQRYARVISRHLANCRFLETMHAAVLSGDTASLCGIFDFPPGHAQKELKLAQDAIWNVQKRMRRISE